VKHVVVEIHGTVKILGKGERWWRRQTSVARASFVVNAKSVTGYTVTV
tara:strand:+ start:225 stop:368 length:144 start_codon:yes stop_codon:yes gene_type:complete